ncbi:MAG TPA: response regulator transcription factor [Verrucomicrobiae bacterium]|nr:response regulator transcription factor [Verrucomicrobiae bacterium]
METKIASPPINIVLVEDDQKTRKGLTELLRSESRVRCAGAYPDGETAVREIPLIKPEVALIDINLPGITGIECVQRLKKLMPKLQVLMLTKYEESDLIFSSLRAGASGYLLKKVLAVELISAIEQVYAGGAPMTMQIARKVVEHFNQIKSPAADLEKLTPREHEVLALLAKGFLYKEISDQLGISQHTFRTHQRAIYEKLHVHSRTEATVKYFGRE